jgi:excisionase family DNA binding protein
VTIAAVNHDPNSTPVVPRAQQPGRTSAPSSRGSQQSHHGQAGQDPPADSTRHWMTIRQIADELSVSLNTVYKWSARGRPWFPKAIRLRNGDVRIRRDWYEAWLAEQPAHGGPAA